MNPSSPDTMQPDAASVRKHAGLIMDRESAEVARLINDGALFVINHSGGKDSQVMMIEMLKIVPKAQLVAVHATLGEVEWEGALEHAKFQADQAGVPFIVAEAVKTLIGMVEHRFNVRPDAPSWPSASNRQCTSDLKRGPIEREVRRYMKANGFTKVVNCMGLRAAESNSRAKLAPWKRNERNSIAGRDWYDWLPIHSMQTDKVFDLISAAGQQPHWAYAAGNERLSCVFCIMASGRDLANGAKHNPALFNKYVQLEQRTGYTMHMSRKSLVELVGQASDDTFAGYETEPCDLLADEMLRPSDDAAPSQGIRTEAANNQPSGTESNMIYAQVFHADYSPDLDKGIAFLPDEARITQAWNNQVQGVSYRMVAGVTADDLEDVFRLTNSIDRNWAENPGVQPMPLPFGKGGYRSTSVGDIIVVGDDAFYVDSSGFAKLNAAAQSPSQEDGGEVVRASRPRG